MRNFDEPLPSFEEVGIFLLIALGLWLLGRILLAASNALDKNSEKSSVASTLGCLGIIVIAAAFLCLIPLLMWVENIGLAILVLVGIVILVGFLFEVIKGWFK